jgi:hypothetical protein
MIVPARELEVGLWTTRAGWGEDLGPAAVAIITSGAAGSTVCRGKGSDSAGWGRACTVAACEPLWEDGGGRALEKTAASAASCGGSPMT